MKKCPTCRAKMQPSCFRSLISVSIIANNVISAGGTAEDCAVALYAETVRLAKRVAELEAKSTDQGYPHWQCPTCLRGVWNICRECRCCGHRKDAERE